MSNTKIKSSQFHGVVGHGTDGYFLMTNADGSMSWSQASTGPSITSVAYPGDDTAADPAGGQTVVLTGTGFAASGMTVTIGGTTAPSVAHDSNTQLTITTPAKAAGDYDIVVTNSVTGASGTFVNGISYNGVPTWTTAAGSLGTFESETTISTITLQATEPDGGTITFNITNGALPTGLSLTGANIDGTTTAESSTTLYSFTIEAIDDENQSTPRNFSITVNAATIVSSENFTINTYTGNGSTQSIEGKIGTAADFNGSSSKFNTGIVLDSTTFSVSLWFKTSVTGRTIIGNFNSSASSTTDRDGFIIQPDKYIFNNNDVEIFRSNYNAGDLADGSWHHIIVTNDGSNSKVYIDGSLDRTDNSSGWNTLGTQDIHLGFTQRNPIVNWYDGLIDQVRIFNKALSSSEVTTLYSESNSSTTKSTTDIFDDGSGVALYEFEKGAIDTGGTSGKIGSGGIFNGSSSRVSLPSSINTNYITPTGSFSASTWVNFNTIGTAEQQIICFNTTANLELSLNTNSNTGKIVMRIYKLGASPENVYLVSTTTLTANNWYHIAVTYNNGSWVLYINGSLEDTGTQTLTQPTTNIYLGERLNNSQYLNGKIDQVRLFNKALSSSEVTTLYGETSASATKSTTDIFDDGSGVALYELEGNANDTGKFGRGAIDSGQSAVFSGSSSSYVDLGSTIDNPLKTAGEFGVSLWFNADSYGSSPVIFKLLNDIYVYIYINASNQLECRVYNSSDVGSIITANISLNTWYHVIWTGSSTNGVSLYLNGSLEGNTSWDGTFLTYTNASYKFNYLGYNGSNTGIYSGKIDQVRVYSTELSSSDVISLISETNVPTTNLIAHYKLDGNANDETGTYNGTANSITYTDPAQFPVYNGTATNVSYAYDGTATNVNFLGMAFQPDLVWLKGRDSTWNHLLYDSVRGAQKELHSNTTDSEGSDVNILQSFDTNGFTLGSSGEGNFNGQGYVAWNWKAASSNSTNTDGSITSTVRANQDAGFSIVKYTGTGASATVGHGLSQAPELIITKHLNGTSSGNVNWNVQSSLYTGYMQLNTTDVPNTTSGREITPGSSTNTLTTGYVHFNDNGYDYIQYNFHSVDGYQKIGSYNGTGASGNTITTGFKPRFLMIKNSTGVYEWVIVDSIRGGDRELNPNSSAAENGTGDPADIGFTSTGFVINNAEGATNQNNATIVYLAIA